MVVQLHACDGSEHPGLNRGIKTLAGNNLVADQSETKPPILDLERV